MTSVQNCFTAPAMTGPLQTTGAASSSMRRFNDMTLIPFLVSTGKIPSSLPFAFCLRPKAFGIEGPVISASRIATFLPFLLALTASREVTRDFPTPPLPETTPITFLMSESLFGIALRSCFSQLPLEEQEEQLCEQSSLILYSPKFLDCCYCFVCYTNITTISINEKVVLCYICLHEE